MKADQTINTPKAAMGGKRPPAGTVAPGRAEGSRTDRRTHLCDLAHRLGDLAEAHTALEEMESSGKRTAADVAVQLRNIESQEFALVLATLNGKPETAADLAVMAAVASAEAESIGGSIASAMAALPERQAEHVWPYFEGITATLDVLSRQLAREHRASLPDAFVQAWIPSERGQPPATSSPLMGGAPLFDLDAPSPIGALIARMRHLADRAHRLELVRVADAGPILPAPEIDDVPAWETAVWDEYFGLEDCVLRSEPATVTDALTVLLVAVGKADTLVANLQPSPDSDDSDYRLAALIRGALDTAAAFLLRRFGADDLAGAISLARPNVAVGAHGPALADLPSEAELEARRAKRGAELAAAATGRKGGAA